MIILAGAFVICADLFFWALCYACDENTPEEDEAQAAYLAQYEQRRQERKRSRRR